jgi:hypothetical protein
MEMKMKALEKTVEQLNKDLLKNATATKEASKAAGTATGNIQRMGIAFRTTLGPIVAVYGAVNFLNKSLQVASQRQVNVAKLTNGLKNLGGTAADLENLADAADKFGRATLFDQEDATEAFALLTSFQRIGVDSYERVTNAAADLATVTGQDLKGAMTQLSKALEDPARRVTDLARSGTVFTEQQKEQIKALQESGQLFEAQSLILAEIEKQYGGAAEAAGSAGLAGALDTLGEATRDFQEQLVTGTDAINLAEGAIYALAGAIDNATQVVKDFQTLIVALDGIIKQLSGGLTNLAGVFDFLNEAVINSVPGLKEAIFAYEQLIKLAGMYNDRQAGQRNFGSNYASQEKALFAAAGGYTPYKPKTGGGGSGSGSGSGSKSSGVDKATRELERQRKELEKQFEAGENIKRNLENQMMLISAATDLEKERLQIAINLDETVRRIKETAAPGQQEGLIVSATELARLEDMKLIIQSFAEDVGAWDFIPEVNDELTQTQELLKGSYEIIAGELTGAIEGLVKGTADWGDVLSSILSQLGGMFLNAGVSGLGTALFPGFADGGRPPVNQPSIVGERGPELWIPDSAGTVVNNADTRAALDRYTTVGATNYSSNLNITTGPVMQMNNDQYIKREDFERGLRQATQDGAKQGEAMTLKRLKNSRSTRSTLGM